MSAENDAACGSIPPNVGGPIPCHLEAGHDGEHFSTSGCAGSEIRWLAAESDARRRHALTCDFANVPFVESCECNAENDARPDPGRPDLASTDRAAECGAFAAHPTTDCPICGRTAKECNASKAKGWDNCCQACDAAGHVATHRLRVLPPGPGER